MKGHRPDTLGVCGHSLAGRGTRALRCAPCARHHLNEKLRAYQRDRRRRERGTPPERFRERPAHIATITPLTSALLRDTRHRLGWSYRTIAQDFGVSVMAAWTHAQKQEQT